ncbi:response regulator transcription factor [Streptomyces sp. NRRL S-340]|uniref:response regulator transcription factor n=1 Tax=Streptomyces sp. NRRL S-340 TaxID=1463901 RepID=UPI00055CA70E|nr:response regulator transcription factor [Streptomyces sp. NRRL S-340]
MRILVVQHDPDLAELISGCLLRIGFDTDTAAGLADADLKLRGSACHGLVGDRAQPDGDVLRLVAAHRRAGWTRPVLMLTAVDSSAERVTLIEQGADDHLVKPFTTAGLTSRALALFRAPVVVGQASRLRFGDLERTAHDGRFTRAGVPLSLTVTEEAVLRALMLASGALVTRDRLAMCCAGDRHPPDSDAVDALIGRLRRRLGHPDPVRSVRGIGYRLVDPA